MKQIKYALWNEKQCQVSFVSDSIEQREIRIKNAFWNKKGMNPKGNDYTIEDFLKGLKQVKLIIVGDLEDA